MSYAMQKLTEELQKAVAMRGTNQQAPASRSELLKARFEISPGVADYFRKMRTYREQSRSVRIGRY